MPCGCCFSIVLLAGFINHAPSCLCSVNTEVLPDLPFRLWRLEQFRRQRFSQLYLGYFSHLLWRCGDCLFALVHFMQACFSFFCMSSLSFFLVLLVLHAFWLPGKGNVCSVAPHNRGSTKLRTEGSGLNRFPALQRANFIFRTTQTRRRHPWRSLKTSRP